MLRGYLSLNKAFSEMAVAATMMAMVAAVPSAPAFASDVNALASEQSAAPKWRMRLQFGIFADKNGDKDEAFEAYRDVAEQGHPGARWKLAHMYASGEGVPENDYEAFKLFEEIAQTGAQPGSREGSYVADALVSLGSYFQRGIPGSPIQADPARARELYWQAAANFGDSDAQFELGRMFLTDEGGGRNPRQAAKWFNLSASKGHVGAQAMLGNMMFEGGDQVRGLAHLTAALNRAGPKERPWIRVLQEKAFGLSDEAVRRTAFAHAQSLQ